MALLNRLSGGVLFVVFLSTVLLPSLAQAAMIQSQTSYYNAGNYDTYPPTGLALAQQACEDRGATSYSYNCTTEGFIVTGDFCRNENYQYLIHNGTRYMCSDEEPPPPECPIPEGQVRGLTTNYRISQVCFENCKFEKPQKTICIFLNDGTSRCLSDYTSTGEYCDDEDGASSAPFDDYVDEEGCYNSTDGHRYCESPADAQCPNYTTVDGKKYCREPEDEDFDSDGDGIPDSEDPYPNNPDNDGDALPDGSDPDPNNPDSDGDGVPDGEDDDPDGDGEPGYSGGDTDSDGEAGKLEDGECKSGNRIEPTCENFDPVNCAIFLETWNSRCDEVIRAEEFDGTEDYREGDSLLDGDENEANTIKSTEIDFGQFLSGLDASGAGFGGAMSCPADKTVNLGFTSITFSFSFICEWADRIRPIIIMLGWLSAGFIAFRSMSGKED